jgi:hypothetical protein
MLAYFATCSALAYGSVPETESPILDQVMLILLVILFILVRA